MNFYKRYMGDFARKTAHLTLIERGAYDSLLDHYYATETPLPADVMALYRIAGAMSAPERKAVDAVAIEFFPLHADGLRHNKRADEEISKHQAQAAINREIGKRGGRPRKTETITESVSQSVSESEPNRNPNHSQKELKEAAATPPPDPLWGDGIAILTAAGATQANARVFIGKCLKSWDAEVVTDALAESRGTADPKAYVTKLLQAKPKKHGQRDYTAGAV